MAKYTRFLPRTFPACDRFQLLNCRGELTWQWPDADEDYESSDPAVPWDDFVDGIERRTTPDGRTQFRSALLARGTGTVGWLVVNYDMSVAVPMDTARGPMQRAFTDAVSFMQEELELQTECNQLAAELTERYEELNLVYTTE